MNQKSKILVVGSISILLLVISVALYQKRQAAFSQVQAGTANAVIPNDQEKETASSDATPPSRTQKLTQEDHVEVVLDKEGVFHDRMKSLYEIRHGSLPAQYDEKLRDILKDRDEHPTIRNDVFEILHQNTKDPDGLAKDLLRTFDDPATGNTWKDYSLQHCAVIYDDANSLIRKKIEVTLLGEAENPKSLYQGTALISLQRLLDNSPDAANGTLAARVSELTRNIATQSDDHLIQGAGVCMAIEGNDATILPEARKLTLNPQTEIRLRLSSIAAVASFGNPDDQAILQELSNHEDSRIKRVVAHWLPLMNKRLEKRKEALSVR